VKVRRHEKSKLRQLTRRIARAENEVMEAMAVMDAMTGKLMNYRQLMQSPKHKEVWSRSSANEFGRLAQGVGGRVKGTNTITSFEKATSHMTDKKTSHMDNLYAAYGRRKRRCIKHDSQ
jgi:hypothetical protein